MEHRYTSVLPAAVVAAAPAEAEVLRASILAGFAAALAPLSSGGQADVLEAMRQLKRINALTALKYELPDIEFVTIANALMTLIFLDGIDVGRQTSLMNATSRLMRKKRRTEQLCIPWRPLWQLYQSHYLSHATPRSRAGESLVSAHASALVHLVRKASAYFPASAAAEVVAVATPSFAALQTHAPFTAQAFLWLFLPNGTCFRDLPAGTGEHWMRVWSWVDHCAQWDGVWASLFARLAHPARLHQAGGTAGAGFEWGAHIPFLAARLQSLLSVAVAGGRPHGKAFPPDAAGLLSGIEPRGVDAVCKLLVRLMTVPPPPALAAAHGDAPPPGRAPEDEFRGFVGDASVMGHLERLLRSTSTMFYPTHRGAHGFLAFLRCLCARLAKRLGREVGGAQAEALLARAAGGRPPLATHQLDAHLLSRFVDATLPLAVMGLYAGTDNRGAVGDAARCMKVLAQVAPARVAREITSMAGVALDPGALNQTHQAPNALSALALLTRSLLYPVPHLAAYLPSALHASLPGVDPNDMGKTVATLSFVHAVLSCVPIVDGADMSGGAGAGGDDDSGEGLAALLPAWHPASPAYALPAAPAPRLGGRVGAFGPADTALAAAARGGEAAGEDMDVDGGSTAAPSPLAPEVLDAFLAARQAQVAIAEWVPLFLDRVFRLLEAREKPAKGRGNAAKQEDALTGWLAWCLSLLFAQLSPTLLRSSTERVLEWVGGVACLDCTKDVALLLCAVAAADRGAVFRKLLPLHCGRACTPEVSPSMLRWHLLLLQAVVRESGPALTPHVPALAACVRAGFASEDKPARKAAGKLLRWVLSSLLGTYSLTPGGSHNPSELASPGTLWTRWGAPTSLVDGPGLGRMARIATGAGEGAAAPTIRLPLPPRVELEWHAPSPAERAAALALVGEFLVAPMLRLQRLTAEQGARGAAGRSSGASSPTPLHADATDAAPVPYSPPASAPAPLPPPPSASALERVRVDLEVMLAAVRGAIFALADGATGQGDDDVLVSGTAGQALVFSAPAGVAQFAVGAGEAGLAPLRQVLSQSLGAYGLLLSGHPELSRDTKAVTLLTKLSHRLVSGRGPRLGKTVSMLGNCRLLKRSDQNVVEHSRVRQLVKACAAAAAAAGAASVRCSAPITAGLASQASRPLLLARLRTHWDRRVAETIYSVPRALHWGRSARAIGDGMTEDEPGVLGPGGDGDAAASAAASSLGGSSGAAGGAEPLLDDDEGDTDPEMSLLAPAPAGEGEAASPASGPPLPAFLRPAIPIFGRRALAHLTPAEQPYALLLASVALLCTHPYENARRKAQGTLATLLSVFAWLRRPAQLAALRRLEALATAAVSATAAARAPALRAAAEGYLAAHPVPPSPFLAHLPAVPGGAGSAAAAAGALLSSLSLPPAAAAGAAAAIKHHLARLDVTAGPPPPGATEGGGAPTPSSVLSFDALLSPAAGGGGSSGAGDVVAPFSEVLGQIFVGFAVAPHVMMGDWQLLERGVRVLLRSSHLIRVLPIERQAQVLQAFTVSCIRMLSVWHALPIPAAHRMAPHWRRVRARMLSHLLTAVGAEEGAAALPTAPSASPAGPAPRGSPPAGARMAPAADGSRCESLAPLPPSPLHWRYELMVTTFLGVLLTPPLPPPCALAIDSGAPPLPGPGPARGQNAQLLLAPEPAWLWALTSALADSVPVRASAVELLISLLHARRDVGAAAGAPLPPLPRVEALLSSPRFVSQLVMALSNDHPEALAALEAGTDGASRGALSTGMHELGKPLECSVAFVEYARQHLRGGAITSIHHMVLFELLAALFPACVAPVLAACRDLAAGATPATAAAAPATGEAAAMEVEAPSASPPPAPAAQHDLATMRIRHATVAEVLAGFLRTFSLQAVARPEGGGVGGGGPATAAVDFSPSDASLPLLRASLLRKPGAAGGELRLQEAHRRMLDVLDVCAPLMEGVGIEWMDDWYNALRYAARQQHPARLAPVLRYLFAHTTVAVGAAVEPPPPGVELDRRLLASLLAAAERAPAGQAERGEAAASPAIAPSSGASSFTPQFRWLHLSGACMDEMLITADGPAGTCGALPGVSQAAEEAAGLGLPTEDGGGGPGALFTPSAASAAVGLYRRLLPTLLRSLSHRYKNCREAVAAVLAMLLEYGWTAAEAGGGDAGAAAQAGGAVPLRAPPSVGRTAWAPHAIAAMVLLARAALQQQQAIAAAAAAASSGSSSAATPAGAPTAEAAAPLPVVSASSSSDPTWGKRVLESILYFLSVLSAGDAIATLPLVLPLLPTLLAAQNHPDRELAGVAGGVLGSVAHNLVLARRDPRDTAADGAFLVAVEAALGRPAGAGADGSNSPSHVLLAELEGLAALGCDGTAAAAGKDLAAAPGAAPGGGSALPTAAAAAWYVRRAVLSFLTPVRAHALMLLTRREDAQLQALVEGRIEDPQVEVQEAAAEALVGFAVSLPTPAQQALAERFIALAAAKLPKRVAAPLSFAAASPSELEEYRKYKARLARAVAKRHAGVLGAGAVVRAHPFDVPEFLPSVLSAIARHVSDPSPVSGATREVVRNFRATHSDNWESHRMAFTADELSDLTELLVSASYYA